MKAKLLVLMLFMALGIAVNAQESRQCENDTCVAVACKGAGAKAACKGAGAKAACKGAGAKAACKGAGAKAACKGAGAKAATK